ncbi:hypothetical protein IMZ48_20975, partial [Candidatus Bathyarchaeota archaeon]|nr:hypothetical protein [Candidatus Bathyarchaeota archaeon]
MEKFNQFRDKGMYFPPPSSPQGYPHEKETNPKPPPAGSGIAPWHPFSYNTSFAARLFHTFLFCCRLPVLIGYAAVYFLFLDHLPLPGALRKLLIWGFMCIPGIWWVDLQLDGVRRGHLSEQPANRMP